MSATPADRAAAPTRTALSAETYAALPPEVDRPAYDRAAVTAGIVHFGVGGFHRAHEAMYRRPTDERRAHGASTGASAASGSCPTTGGSSTR